MSNANKSSENPAKTAGTTGNPETNSSDANSQQKADFDNREANLNEREEALNQRELALNERETKLDQFEEELKKRDEEISKAHIAVLNSTVNKPAEPEFISDEIIAVNGEGKEQSFPKAAWNNLGNDKGGWVQKVNVPKEAQEG